MRDSMQHRGPDDDGVHTFENGGLVHTRLAIVDPTPDAAQPMARPGADLVISFNGEIFNHLAVRQGLTAEAFSSSGDTETLLRLLAERGPEAIVELNGQFALAVLDIPNRRVLLTRDRFGIKPLYLADTPSGVWFASELAALVAAGVPAHWRDDGWAVMRSGSCYTGTRTFADGIVRVPAGVWTSVCLDTRRIEHWPWWSPADAVSLPRRKTLAIMPRRALVGELEQVLRHAVHDSLLSDVPVGTLCSGGVDSSLITALAAEVHPDLVAFGAHYPGDPALDEGPAARRAAEAIGVELDLLEITAAEWRAGFVRSSVHFGVPLANASSVVIALMAQRARRREIKVLLTGEGADELFAGYGGLHDRRLAAFLHPAARAVRAMEPMLVPGPNRSTKIVGQRLQALVARRRTEPGWSSLNSEPDGGVAADRAALAYGAHEGPRGALEADLLSHMSYTLGHLLNRMDKNMMQCSVETRVPFLDPRVVAFAVNAPLQHRVGPWTKGILRDVARRLLPVSVAHRPKIYGLNFDAGEWIGAAANPGFLLDGMLRGLRGVSRETLASEVAATGGADLVRIWSTEVWCRSMLGGHSVESIEADLWPTGP